VSPKTKRQHRKTGAPRGGRREGAGRPEGANNALPSGAVSAIRALRLRVPDAAPLLAAELAGEALERIVDVMRGKVRPERAFPTLTAAKAVREEVCGPIVKKHEVAGPGGAPVTITINRTVASAPGPEDNNAS
jgi:hypothetical protein